MEFKLVPRKRKRRRGNVSTERKGEEILAKSLLKKGLYLH